MARFGRVWSLIEWFRHYSLPFFSFLRCFIPRIQIAGLLHLPVRWRNGGEDPKGPAVKEDDTLPSSLPEVELGQQHEATAGSEPQSSDGSEDDDFDSEDYRVHATDELYCGYDSTWESDDLEESTSMKPRSSAGSRSTRFGRFENAARDMQNYRHDYPSQIRFQYLTQHSGCKSNLEFYLGRQPCLPDGIYIHDFHNEWYGEYDTLEYVHTYIQWLFPLQEPGMNSEAPTLTKEEIKDFRNSSTAKENLLKSYELMLDFYGITLCDRKTGEVQRASNWRERFNNLNSHTHNNLRITRILKCIGTLGYPCYQYPLVRFFLNETLVNGELPRVKESVLNYFVFAVLDKMKRRDLLKFAYLNYVPKDEFVWCPKKIQMMWSQSQKRINVDSED